MDCSIPIAIQPVVTGNMVDITVLVNVSNNEIIQCFPRIYIKGGEVHHWYMMFGQKGSICVIKFKIKRGMWDHVHV